MNKPDGPGELLSQGEILDAFASTWRYANLTDDEDRFVRPEYRQALQDVWTDICVAARIKRDQSNLPHPTLNVAMTRRGKNNGASGTDNRFHLPELLDDLP